MVILQHDLLVTVCFVVVNKLPANARQELDLR